MASKKLRAVGAYVYAGGFSLGVQRAGFDIVAHLEDPKPYGQEVIDLNREKYWGGMGVHAHPAWPVYKGLDLLYANPPCAAFSNANRASFSGNCLDDPRVECWGRVFDYVEASQPKIFAVESVTEMYTKGRPMVATLVERAQELGYRPHLYFHNVRYHGTWQNRRRLLVIGTKVDFSDSGVLYGTPKTVADWLRETKGLDVKKDLELDRNLAPKLLSNDEFIASMSPGERATKTFDRVVPADLLVRVDGRTLGRPSFGVSRLDQAKGSPAVVGDCLVHPVKHRFLTIKEYQMLGGFPAEYQLPRNKHAIKYVARGVCPAMGEWRGQVPKVSLEARKPLRGDLRLRVWDHLSGPAARYERIVPLGAELPEVKVSIRVTV
jgi:site-specific DNA-cytosine methylase